MSKPTVLPPGEGKRVEARGSVMIFKATSATTEGGLSLMERELPVGATRIPPAHAQSDRLEAFYVLEGRVDFKLDSETVSCGPGWFVLLPSGVGHTFWNSGTAAARVLIIHAPALDPYFEALAALWSGAQPPSTNEELGLMQQFGMEPMLNEGSRQP